MLIDEPTIFAGNADPTTRAILAIIADGVGTKQLRTGVYQIGGFNGHLLLPRGKYNEYPNFNNYPSGAYLGPYGVCDGADNLIEVYGSNLIDPDRQFVVTLTEVKRNQDNAGQGGGWRWHKWGAYIGKHTPTMEYLDD